MKDFQREYSDKFIAAIILPFIPGFIRPNHISWARLFSVPFVLFFLWNELYLVGVILFSLSALTDAIDGAQARTRDQITEFGKLLDPVADRSLIIGAAIILIPRFYGTPLFVVIAVLEALQSLRAHFIKEKLKRNLNANWAGKLKMIVQSFSIIILLLGVLIQSRLVIIGVEYLLFLSIAFLIVEPFVYVENREYKKEKKELKEI